MSLDNLDRWTDDEQWRERARHWNSGEVEGDGAGVIFWALLAMAGAGGARRLPRVAGAVMGEHYTLDANHNVVPANLMTWARRFESSDRVVARTKVYEGCDVSTVFLGLDHRFGAPGPPLVFETMVFGGPFDQDMNRYATWADAEAGHARMVDKCQPIMTEDAR